MAGQVREDPGTGDAPPTVDGAAGRRFFRYTADVDTQVMGKIILKGI